VRISLSHDSRLQPRIDRHRVRAQVPDGVGSNPALRRGPGATMVQRTAPSPTSVPACLTASTEARSHGVRRALGQVLRQDLLSDEPVTPRPMALHSRWRALDHIRPNLPSRRVVTPGLRRRAPPPALHSMGLSMGFQMQLARPVWSGPRVARVTQKPASPECRRVGAPVSRVGQVPARGVTARLAHLDVVGSDRGAVATFRPLRLPGPPSEPNVRVATHPALHDLMPMQSPSILPPTRPTARGSVRPGCGSG
jgi:hypothetical protein